MGKIVNLAYATLSKRELVRAGAPAPRVRHTSGRLEALNQPQPSAPVLTVFPGAPGSPGLRPVLLRSARRRFCHAPDTAADTDALESGG